jgi:hypothetical protein
MRGRVGPLAELRVELRDDRVGVASDRGFVVQQERRILVGSRLPLVDGGVADWSNLE